MPFYHAHVRPGLLDWPDDRPLERRRRGALWVTTTPFVHVMIIEDLDRCPRARTAGSRARSGRPHRRTESRNASGSPPSGPAGRYRCHDDLSHLARHRGVVHDGGRAVARTGFSRGSGLKAAGDQRPRTDLNVTTRGAAGLLRVRPAVRRSDEDPCCRPARNRRRLERRGN